MTVRIFGIRHHGPGSARSLLKALETWQPDAILIEGPPEAESVLPLVTSPEMKPPVALLLYVRDRPQQAVYYPFAVYSPEWQALRYGLTHDISVQWMDLPQGHRFPLREMGENGRSPLPDVRRDPLGELARAAGFADGEQWWEVMVEQRRDATDLFEAILEAMAALREETDLMEDLDVTREAYMRKTIRNAEKKGFDRMAVVCGAWHAPALADKPPAKVDNAILKGLPKTQVCATWIPWTYGRLADRSGYGAGVPSPGWYHHLWEMDDRPASEVAVHWMVRVARLLREQGLETSSARTIEAVRLAQTLAALRDRPIPGLTELNDATEAVMGNGSELPMRLVWEQSIVSDRMGEVPEETPTTPLQQNLRDLQKRLRLKPEATPKTLTLDLRKALDLARSNLLHQLRLLDIPWGHRQRTNGLGTFKEVWELAWQPEFAVMSVDASIWGNTVRDAAAACGIHQAREAATLRQLTELLDLVLLAALPESIETILDRVQAISATTRDSSQLMDALPALARIWRYGNVRQTDVATIERVIDGLVVRSCLGLPDACVSLNDEVAKSMRLRMLAFNGAISLLQQEMYRRQWFRVLGHLAQREKIHGSIGGVSCRLLLDAGEIEVEEVERLMGLALSTVVAPPHAAAWIEGFLDGSGLLLLHDDRLFAVLDRWLRSLPEKAFVAVLPLLRRTFSTFEPAERRQIGAKVRRDGKRTVSSTGDLDLDRAAMALSSLEQLLG